MLIYEIGHSIQEHIRKQNMIKCKRSGFTNINRTKRFINVTNIELKSITNGQ